MRLKGSYETFGIVLDFLAGVEPFARYDLGNLARSVQYQLHQGDHLAAVTRDRLVGYCGWLPTTTLNADAWMSDGIALAPLTSTERADAVLLTIVAARDRVTAFALFGQLARLNSFERVYFKREYPEKTRASRKRVVSNMRGAGL
jgi:hypothetical protein